MQIYLVRHGKTLANEQKLYCGQTDVPLAESGMKELITYKNQGIYPASAGLFFTSGMMRAEQTIEIIYGKVERTRVPALAEYNFGLFEMKSHDELKDTEGYQRWLIDEAGDPACPGGESKNQFKLRVVEGYAGVLSKVRQAESDTAFIVCHGGTITRIMEHLQPNTHDFYGWQPQPGRGYTLVYDDEQFHEYKTI